MCQFREQHDPKMSDGKRVCVSKLIDARAHDRTLQLLQEREKDFP
jgi:hypothetical protein